MDTLRKDFLKTYNENSFVSTPNLDQFAQDSVIFDNHFIGSTPCMPARRDIMTGRLNFLERSWGPIEPFDITFPQLLKDNNIFTHLTTDHTHYFRLGGEGYINQFTTWDFQRGQEGDPWVSQIKDPEWMPEQYCGKLRKQYQANRMKWYENEEEYPTPRTFRSACEWLENNKNEDDFFIQVEVFDPHEPFDVPTKYMNMYDSTYQGPYFETPNYGAVDVSERQVEYIRNRYAALMTMTDEHFGRLIKKLKDLEMYDDTLIIVTSDHGYFLGEKGLFGKNYMHNYNEIAAIPMMMKTPKNFKTQNNRVKNVTQNIDIMPTVLELFKIKIPSCVSGKSLLPLLNGQDNGKKYALYGAHGITINITDGCYTYFKSPNEENSPLFEYAAIPTTIRHYLGENNPLEIEVGRFLKRTSYPVFKVPISKAAILDGLGDMSSYTKDDLLFDIVNDPKQENPILNAEIEAKMKQALIAELKAFDAPAEQLIRLELEVESNAN